MAAGSVLVACSATVEAPSALELYDFCRGAVEEVAPGLAEFPARSEVTFTKGDSEALLEGTARIPSFGGGPTSTQDFSCEVSWDGDTMRMENFNFETAPP